MESLPGNLELFSPHVIFDSEESLRASAAREVNSKVIQKNLTFYENEAKGISLSFEPVLSILFTMVSSVYTAPVLLCLGLVGPAFSQVMWPLMFGELGEGLFDFFGSGQGSYLMLNQLSSRLSRLEMNVRTGAVGGCESGVVGPLSPLQPAATIQFRGSFLTPPAISLALSDISTADATNPVSVQVRPSAVSSSSANITLTDLGSPSNVASAFIAYMVCPSNSSPAVHGNSHAMAG
ncbi:hypothetical protein RRG08_041157 [Elysia crispata]|uniref:H-type lectin domain-containing protein n=1 Tax=Elysia crispata TaxID=231223 RepID=A0AAE0XXP8_9GAST|nr:hypothetical protein RRG08_041157 [Elysia crispata]